MRGGRARLTFGGEAAAPLTKGALLPAFSAARTCVEAEVCHFFYVPEVAVPPRTQPVHVAGGPPFGSFYFLEEGSLLRAEKAPEVVNFDLKTAQVRRPAVSLLVAALLLVVVGTAITIKVGLQVLDALADLVRA